MAVGNAEYMLAGGHTRASFPVPKAARDRTLPAATCASLTRSGLLSGEVRLPRTRGSIPADAAPVHGPRRSTRRAVGVAWHPIDCWAGEPIGATPGRRCIGQSTRPPCAPSPAGRAGERVRPHAQAHAGLICGQPRGDFPYSFFVFLPLASPFPSDSEGSPGPPTPSGRRAAFSRGSPRAPRFPGPGG